MCRYRIIVTVAGPAALTLALAAAAAQAQSPHAAEDHHKRGLALGQRGELDRAMADFDRAIELDPRIVEARLNHGSAGHDK